MLSILDAVMTNDGKTITCATNLGGYGFSFQSGKLTNYEYRALLMCFDILYEPCFFWERLDGKVLVNRSVGVGAVYGIGDGEDSKDLTDGVVWARTQEDLTSVMFNVFSERRKYFPYVLDDTAYYVRNGNIYLPPDNTNKRVAELICICGGKAYIGFNSHECSNPVCKHYKKK